MAGHFETSSRRVVARLSPVAQTPSHAELFSELAELIAIPSISADPAHAADLARAAEWVAERIRRGGEERFRNAGGQWHDTHLSGNQ